MKERKSVTVMKNSYVTLERHHYSVPTDYIGKRVDIVYDSDILEIYHGLRLVTVHQRDDTPYAYTTKEAHNLPGRHGTYEQDLEEVCQRTAFHSGGDGSRCFGESGRNGMFATAFYPCV